MVYITNRWRRKHRKRRFMHVYKKYYYSIWNCKTIYRPVLPGLWAQRIKAQLHAISWPAWSGAFRSGHFWMLWKTAYICYRRRWTSSIGCRWETLPWAEVVPFRICHSVSNLFRQLNTQVKTDCGFAIGFSAQEIEFIQAYWAGFRQLENQQRALFPWCSVQKGNQLTNFLSPVRRVCKNDIRMKLWRSFPGWYVCLIRHHLLLISQFTNVCIQTTERFHVILDKNRSFSTAAQGLQANCSGSAIQIAEHRSRYITRYNGKQGFPYPC